MTGTTPTFLPIPNFAAPIVDCRAGVRPYRAIGYRLEISRPPSHPRKRLIHNYGHGGAGISLSWGVAEKVRSLVRSHIATSGDRSVAVIGSGVMGLTAATLLRELGVDVTIYAKEFWRDTTSFIAGGQWAPSVVKASDQRQFREVLETAYRMFERSIGDGFGVSKMHNYTTELHPAFEAVLQLCPGLLDSRKDLANLPFQTLRDPGFRYTTLLIEPHIFLKRLDEDLRAAGVVFKCRTFLNRNDVLSVPENVIINCTGFGAKALFNDNDLSPIKGQLAFLPPQPELTYLFGRSGYMFPRCDAVVIGGTFDEGDPSTNPVPARCLKLVNDLKGVFGVGPRVLRPEYHIHHPRNIHQLGPLDDADV